MSRLAARPGRPAFDRDVLQRAFAAATGAPIPEQAIADRDARRAAKSARYRDPVTATTVPGTLHVELEESEHDAAITRAAIGRALAATWSETDARKARRAARRGAL